MKSGFTLIEIIVSLGIFSIVAVVALGALLRIVTANAKAQTLHDAITNLNFGLESMSREMRVGAGYTCLPASDGLEILPLLSGTLCSDGIGGPDDEVVIAFYSSERKVEGLNDCRLIYAYTITKDPNDQGHFLLKKGRQSGCNQSLSIDNENVFHPILDPSVKIQSHFIKTNSVNPTAAIHYPMVTIKLSGYAGVRERERTYFDVQTSVAARVP